MERARLFAQLCQKQKNKQKTKLPSMPFLLGWHIWNASKNKIKQVQFQLVVVQCQSESQTKYKWKTRIKIDFPFRMCPFEHHCLVVSAFKTFFDKSPQSVL